MRAGPAQGSTPAAAFPAAPFGSVPRPVLLGAGCPAKRFAPVRSGRRQAAAQPACPAPLDRAVAARRDVPRDVPVVQPALRQGRPPDAGRRVKGAAGPVAAPPVAPIGAAVANFAAADAPVQL